jgi:hypothetical protein
MENNRAPQTEGKTIAIAVAIVASLLALATIALNDPSGDVALSEVSFDNAPATTLKPVPEVVQTAKIEAQHVAGKLIRPAKAGEVDKTESWNADESARGTRPDAMH